MAINLAGDLLGWLFSAVKTRFCCPLKKPIAYLDKHIAARKKIKRKKNWSKLSRREIVVHAQRSQTIK
jgi:hypothetical protein